MTQRDQRENVKAGGTVRDTDRKDAGQGKRSGATIGRRVSSRRDITGYAMCEPPT